MSNLYDLMPAAVLGWTAVVARNILGNICKNSLLLLKFQQMMSPLWNQL